VIEFCARLSRYTGREYGLPSEAEWEYACRANTVTPFHFGETIDPQVANYNGGYVYGRGQKGIDRSKTIPVGSLNAANEYGLHDMHGNVWEWCQDHWHNNYQGATFLVAVGRLFATTTILGTATTMWGFG
jgi:formylglycine-generating enzyme required for sulfatase activity